MYHYTSIEQSKKLLELGLNPESADMQYTMLYDRAIDGGNNRLSDIPSIKIYTMPDDIPCWSAGALLEIIPDVKDCTLLLAKCQGKVGMCLTPLDSGLAICETEIYDRVFDAIYKMVINFLENKYIK